MATYAITGVGTTGFPATGPNVRVIAEVVDFSSTTNAASDVFQTLSIPADTVVLGAGINVITADSAGNSGTIELGDGGDANRYVAASTVAAAGQETAIFATTVPHLYDSADTIDMVIGTALIAPVPMTISIVSAVPHLYDSADTIDMVIGTGAINAVVRVWAIIADCTGGVETAQTVTFS